MNYRKLILEHSKKAGAGHIGSALSVVDIIYVLYDQILNIPNLDSNERDRFVLSKGHAGLALYVNLFLKGFISQKDLDTYCSDDTKLGVHPEHYLPGVDFSTGSLGQGITFATGAALAAKIEKSQRMVFCLLSDAELNEGSFWETILFASHHKLTNLVFILDNNGQQALGYTKDVINLGDFKQKIESFDFETISINGHDVESIKNSLHNIKDKYKSNKASKPSFVIANTICGKGVSYMENTIEWHYKSMNDTEYTQALKESE